MVRTNYRSRQTAGILDVYLYDDIEPDGYNWWTDEKEESETSASHIQKILSEAGNVTQINLYINSYGGDVKEGMGIYSQLKRHTANKTAYIDGFACSIASVIAMACNNIVMGINGLMMIHHASMGAWGNPDELRKAADDLEIIDASSNSAYLEKAGEKLTPETLKTLLDAETWLPADKCLEYGLCDEILKAPGVNDPVPSQRLSMEQRIKQLYINKVPEKFAEQKTNAEKLMKAFNNKN